MSTDLSLTNNAPPLPAATAPAPVARTAYVVFVRLESGERIEVASHAGEEDARAEATALMRYVSDGSGDWPYLGSRFVRPNAVVSIDVEPALG